LSALKRILALEEGETDEETGDDVEHHLGDDKSWIPPVCLIIDEIVSFLSYQTKTVGST
jgi:hypothetical protein